MIGSVLRIRYEITGLLAEGPIFIAYSARDRLQPRDVCVRLVRSPFDKEPAFLQALQAATGRSALVQNPSVESLIEMDDHEGTPFLVSELTRGASLADRIRKLAPFSIPVSIATAISMLDGLVAVHGTNLIHGDLSTTHVWIQPDGSARIQLAGIWQAYSASETAGSVVLPYMAAYLAPEVSAGGSPSVSSDLYAVGVLLYQLLTGRLPYPAETPIAMALKHATDPVPSVKQLNPSIPVVLDEIVKKALAKDPAKRYGKAEDMLSDLRMLQDAMRFGKSLAWPIRQGGAVAPVKQVAPKMSAVRVERREREEDWEADTGDLPAWMRISIIMALIVLCGLVGAFVYSNLNKPRLVTIPNLKNMSGTEARALLEQSKLRMRVVATVPSEGVPADNVVSEDPPPGSKMREGGDVSVKLSSGSRFVEVPDLKGRTVDEARSILGQVNLALDDRIDDVASNQDRGMIVGESPDTGAKVERNSRVRVQVSNGVSPSASTSAPAAPEPLKYIYTLRLKLTDLKESTIVRIEMKDDFGTRVLFDEEKQPGDQITLNAEGNGKQATFMIYYDDKLIKTTTKNADEGQPAPTNPGDAAGQ